MKKVQSLVDRISEEHDRKMLLAVSIAIFGIILFIALALTLPYEGS
jgi:predicted transcriptional regulator